MPKGISVYNRDQTQREKPSSPILAPSAMHLTFQVQLGQRPVDLQGLCDGLATLIADLVP